MSNWKQMANINNLTPKQTHNTAKEHEYVIYRDLDATEMYPSWP
jgi:hypothetical protein